MRTLFGFGVVFVENLGEKETLSCQLDDFGIDFNGSDVKGRVVGNEVFRKRETAAP